MRNIGCHLSVAKGFAALGRDARQIHATTFQFHSRNPRGGAVKKRTPDDIAAYVNLVNGEAALSQCHVTTVAHAPYTLNPASSDPIVREFALMAFREDYNNLRQFPNCMYNFHPGCHVGQGEDEGIKRIIEILNKVLETNRARDRESCTVDDSRSENLETRNESPQGVVKKQLCDSSQQYNSSLPQSTLILLETMSGKGSEIGWRFEQIRQIIDGVEQSGLLGVCLDTCHIYSAGYDIVNKPEQVLADFDAIIGLDRLKAIHLNDSLHPLGSRKDRHAKIDEGTIGYSALHQFVSLLELQSVPLILETPNDLDGWAKEIQMFEETKN